MTSDQTDARPRQKIILVECMYKNYFGSLRQFIPDRYSCDIYLLAVTWFRHFVFTNFPKCELYRNAFRTYIIGSMLFIFFFPVVFSLFQWKVDLNRGKYIYFKGWLPIVFKYGCFWPQDARSKYYVLVSLLFDRLRN